MNIGFNKPYHAPHTLFYIHEAFANLHISGNGPFTKKCEAELKKIVSCKKALLTTSCTHALEMCALLLDIKPGDEVILPAYTFVSTANAFTNFGAKPVFIDIRPDTLNIDESLIEERITNKTKAIIVVHYGGVGCEMDKICAIAKKNDICLIEDNAHGLMGSYKNKPLGSFGTFATLSFHETKNINCGEGGALLVNDDKYIERAEIIRDKGTNRQKFFRGQVDKYTWCDKGSSYVISDLLAATLLAQLDEKEKIYQKRKEIWHFYYDELQKILSNQDILSLPFIPKHCKQAYHLFYILCKNEDYRNELLKYLNNKDIKAVFHYMPLHDSPMGLSLNPYQEKLPETERLSSSIIRLPFYYDLKENEQNYIVTCIQNFFN